ITSVLATTSWRSWGSHTITTTTPDASIDGTPVGYPMPWLPWRNCQDDRTCSPRRRGHASPHVATAVAHVHSVDSTGSAPVFAAPLWIRALGGGPRHGSSLTLPG